MSERGEHRAIYTVLLQSPEFLDLSPEGQLVWFHLKLMLGPCGIDVIPAVEAQLEEATNMPSEGVRKGMGDAMDKDFLRRERNVLWMVNGLKFEPSRTVTNANHRTSIQKHIGGLPKLKIVNDFADYYGLDRPFPKVGATPSPTPSPSGGDTQSRRTDNGERRTETPPPPRENESEQPTDAVRRIYGWEGTEGTDPILMKAFPDSEEKRDRCLQIAWDRIRAEDEPYKGNFFRGVVETVIGEQTGARRDKPKTRRRGSPLFDLGDSPQKQEAG